MNKLAYQLSYGNSMVKNLLEQIYYSQDSYDENMRDMQHTFRSVIFDMEFESIFIQELNKIMTDMINKMFITI
jgi:truncated hemoglobin YjbI